MTIFCYKNNFAKKFFSSPQQAIQHSLIACVFATVVANH